jgi:hypothetical protein
VTRREPGIEGTRIQKPLLGYSRESLTDSLTCREAGSER